MNKENLTFSMKNLADYMLVHADDRIYVGEVPTTPRTLLSEAMDAGKQIGRAIGDIDLYHGKSAMEKVELSQREKDYIIINERLRKAKNLIELAFVAERTTGKPVIKGSPQAVKELGVLKIKSASIESQIGAARNLVKAFDISQRDFIRECERTRTTAR